MVFPLSNIWGGKNGNKNHYCYSEIPNLHFYQTIVLLRRRKKFRRFYISLVGCTLHIEAFKQLISQTNNNLANPANLAVWPRRCRGWCCSNKLLLYLIS